MKNIEKEKNYKLIIFAHIQLKVWTNINDIVAGSYSKYSSISIQYQYFPLSPLLPHY